MTPDHEKRIRAAHAAYQAALEVAAQRRRELDDVLLAAYDDDVPQREMGEVLGVVQRRVSAQLSAALARRRKDSATTHTEDSTE